MLRMRYNLYNGGTDSADSEAAAYQLNKAKDLRDRAYRQVEEGKTSPIMECLGFNTATKNFLSDHVDSASETVIAYGKQYRISKRTLLDLLNTQRMNCLRLEDYLDAHYAEQYAKYRVMNATGSLMNALLVDIPDEWTTAVEY
ncbi:hypothetical protein OH492_18695 [Vibrio chagasii]|nr:hypothetical protein [Vibrio chagasii]